jgi:hypothetical protein
VDQALTAPARPGSTLPGHNLTTRALPFVRTLRTPALPFVRTLRTPAPPFVRNRTAQPFG